MKSDTKTAMADLILQARQTLPFNLALSADCEGRCDTCPFKLMEYLDTNLSVWEGRLKQGEIPSLGDVHSLARDCKTVHAILQEQRLCT